MWTNKVIEIYVKWSYLLIQQPHKWTQKNCILIYFNESKLKDLKYKFNYEAKQHKKEISNPNFEFSCIFFYL